MSLSSIRGLLLVTGHAPRGVGVIREQNTFMTRAAELMATPGRYRWLVEERRMTIATIPRIMMVQPSENITVEDVAAMFTVDGVTIAQVSDAFEWGRSMLLNLSKQRRHIEKDGGHAGPGKCSMGHKSERAGQASTHRTEVVVPASMDRGNSDNAVRHTTAACTTGACHNSTICPDGPEVGDTKDISARTGADT
jgi:hypothetical protein